MKVTVRLHMTYDAYATETIDVPAGEHPWHYLERDVALQRDLRDSEVDIDYNSGTELVPVTLLAEDGTRIERPESPSETDEYLVVALYDDNEQRFATSVVAKTPAEAEELAAAEAEGDITVAAVICKRTGEVVA